MNSRLDAEREMFPPVVGFQSRKAAQIAAYFAGKSHDGKIEKLKLAKLLYLTERESIKRTGYPMLFDELYSLPHGPICSGALNGIDGKIDTATWEQYISRNGNLVLPTKRLGRDDLDELSDMDCSILEFIWDQFGKMSANAVRNFTHENCPEYTEVKAGSRVPISYLELYKALDYPDPNTMAAEIDEYRRREAILAG